MATPASRCGMYLMAAHPAWLPREEQTRWNLSPRPSASARSSTSSAALRTDRRGSGSLSPYPARSNATMYTPSSSSSSWEARGESMRPPEKPCE